MTPLMTETPPEQRLERKEDERKGAGFLLPWFSRSLGRSPSWIEAASQLLGTPAGMASFAAAAVGLGALFYFSPDLAALLSDETAPGRAWTQRLPSRLPADELARGGGAPANGASASLDYLSQANGQAGPGGAASAPSVDGADAAKDAAVGSPSGQEGPKKDKEEKDADASNAAAQSALAGAASAFGSRKLALNSIGLGSGSAGGGSSAFHAASNAAAGGGSRTPAYPRQALSRGTQLGRAGGSQKALSQLRMAEGLSRSGTSLGSENARATETRAFEGGSKAASPSAGQSAGGTGLGSSASDTPTSSNPSSGASDSSSSDDDDDGENATSYQWMIDLARVLVFVADLLLALAAVMSWGKAALTDFSGLLVKGACLLSLGVVGIGIAIMTQYGQYQQGAILAAAGGVTALAGALALGGVPHASLFLLLGAATSSIVTAIGMKLS